VQKGKKVPIWKKLDVERLQQGNNSKGNATTENVAVMNLVEVEDVEEDQGTEPGETLRDCQGGSR